MTEDRGQGREARGERRGRFILCHIRCPLSAILLLFTSHFLLPTFLPSIHAWELIDVPSTETVDPYTYRLGFRFYRDGGILTRATFGVFRNVNIGFAWGLDNIIGDKTVEIMPPSLHLRVLLFGGDQTLPALALGYDGQGYHWDKGGQVYREKEKGIYLVLSREILTPGLEFLLGGNIYNFRNPGVYGFTGLIYTVGEISFLIEYDNLHHMEFHRLNAGLRLHVGDDMNVELAGRNLGKISAERIIKANYIGRF